MILFKQHRNKNYLHWQIKKKALSTFCTGPDPLLFQVCSPLSTFIHVYLYTCITVYDQAYKLYNLFKRELMMSSYEDTKIYSLTKCSSPQQIAAFSLGFFFHKAGGGSQTDLEKTNSTNSTEQKKMDFPSNWSIFPPILDPWMGK